MVGASIRFCHFTDIVVVNDNVSANSLKYRGRRLGGGSQLVIEYDSSPSQKIKEIKEHK